MEVPGQCGSVAIDVDTNYGAIVVGDHNVVTLKVAAPPVVTRIEPDAVHRPQAVPGFLDRRVETAALLQALPEHNTIEVHGEAGIGKSWFVQQAAGRAAESFADGALCLPPGLQGPRDALQALFEMFYRAEPDTAPSPTRLREYLAARQAVVIVDDHPFDAAALAVVRDAARGCRFICAGSQPRLGDAAQGVRLEGLPADDALALAEQVSGATPGGSDYAALVAAVQAAAGHPRRVIEAARAHRASRASLPAVPPEGDSRRMLDLVCAFAPQGIATDLLAGLSGIADAASVADALLATGWLEREGSRVRAAAPATRLPLPADTAERLRLESLQRLAGAARRERGLRWRALAALPLLWSTLSGAQQAGHADVVLALGQAWHAPLTLAGRWDAWAMLLSAHLRAAREIGRPDAQAWALHQDGTRELALGHADAARSLFEQALVIERTLGDTALQAATRYHLDQMAGLAGGLAGGLTGLLRQQGPARTAVAASAAALVVGTAAWWWAGTPRLVPEQTTLDFGDQPVGAAPALQRVVWRNTGWRTLTAPAVAWRGDAPAGLSLDATGCRLPSLPAGGTCSVSVSFAPPARGAVTATLSAIVAGGAASATASGGARQEAAGALAVQGRGIGGALSLPSELDFGAVEPDRAGAEKNVTVHNLGELPVQLGNFDAARAPFSLTEDACSSTRLAAGAACQLTLRFRPATARDYAQQITVTSDEPGTPRRMLALRGHGARPQLEASPARLEFAPQEVATDGVAQRLELHNRGAVAAGRLVWSLQPPGAPFVVDAGACGGAGLAAGARCEAQLKFVPRKGQRGAHEARVEVRVSGVPPVQVALSARATGAMLAMEPPQVEFAPVSVPNTAGNAGKVVPSKASVLVRNQGDALARLAAVRVAGHSRGDFQLAHDCPAQLEPAASCRVNLSYRPRKAGFGVAQIELDAPGADGMLDAPLVARALAPMPVPELLRPADGASEECFDARKVVRFAWKPAPPLVQRPVRYRLLIDGVERGAVIDRTELDLPVDCFVPQRRWSLEASSENTQPAAQSAARLLLTRIKSGSSGPVSTPGPSQGASR